MVRDMVKQEDTDATKKLPKHMYKTLFFLVF